MFHVEHPVLKENNRPAPLARAVQYQEMSRPGDGGPEEENGFGEEKENSRSAAYESFVRIASVRMRRRRSGGK